MTLLVGSDWRSLLRFPGLVLLGHRFGVVSCTLVHCVLQNAVLTLMPQCCKRSTSPSSDLELERTSQSFSSA